VEAALTRFSALLVPLALVAVPTGAAAPAQYRAELAAPPSTDRLVVRDTVWHCGGGRCDATNGTSRPAILCAALAREAGTVRSFAVEGQAITAPELEKCNARAR
jgi:hypothetical protein